MEPGELPELDQPGNDHLDIDIGRVMAQIDQTKCLWAQFTRAVVAGAPIVNYRRVEGWFVELVLDEESPIVGQRLVNLAHAFQVPGQGAPKMLLSGKVSAVADPNRDRFRAQCPADLNAFKIVGDSLAPYRGIRMGKTAEFVGKLLRRLILK